MKWNNMKWCREHFLQCKPGFGRREQWWIRCLCAAMWQISTLVSHIQTWSAPSAQPAITYWPWTQRYTLNTEYMRYRFRYVTTKLLCKKSTYHPLTRQQTDVRGLFQEISLRSCPASRSHKHNLPSFEELICKREEQLMKTIWHVMWLVFWL